MFYLFIHLRYLNIGRNNLQLKQRANVKTRKSGKIGRTHDLDILRQIKDVVQSRFGEKRRASVRDRAEVGCEKNENSGSDDRNGDGSPEVYRLIQLSAEQTAENHPPYQAPAMGGKIDLFGHDGEDEVVNHEDADRITQGAQNLRWDGSALDI